MFSHAQAIFRRASDNSRAVTETFTAAPAGSSFVFLLYLGREAGSGASPVGGKLMSEECETLCVKNGRTLCPLWDCCQDFSALMVIPVSLE
jgi:hypothetical protein